MTNSFHEKRGSILLQEICCASFAMDGQALFVDVKAGGRYPSAGGIYDPSISAAEGYPSFRQRNGTWSLYNRSADACWLFTDKAISKGKFKIKSGTKAKGQLPVEMKSWWAFVEGHLELDHSISVRCAEPQSKKRSKETTEATPNTKRPRRD